MPYSDEAASITMVDLTEIKVALARVEEKQTSLGEKVDKLAPLSDISALKQDLVDAEKRFDKAREADIKRIEKLESNQTWIVRTVIGAVLAAVLGVIGLGSKKLGM